MNKHSISVIYLCFLPYGLAPFKNFIISYRNMEAGILHELVIVFKGNDPVEKIDSYLSILKAESISYRQLFYHGKGLDIATFFWAAQQEKSDYLFFLNTRSVILCKSWLANFYQSSQINSQMVIGATGSWQSYPSAIIANTTFLPAKFSIENLKKIKLFIKAATIWRYYFPPFPNPHIRTNAFFIKRMLFLSLSNGSILKKMDAYRFESGRNSFTRRLKQKGYEVGILGKNNKVYSELNWKVANIFWTSAQENLMVSDNQASSYFDADVKGKKKLEQMAWGIFSG